MDEFDKSNEECQQRAPKSHVAGSLIVSYSERYGYIVSAFCSRCGWKIINLAFKLEAEATQFIRNHS